MQQGSISLAAHVSGDGWLTKYIEKNCLQIVRGKRYRRGRMRYTIGYCNNNKQLIKLFVNTMWNTFKLRPRYAKSDTQIIFRSKRVYDQLKLLGADSTYNWFIPNIVKRNKKFCKIWLRAFFDDESTIDKNRKIIRIKCMNKKGLYSVKKLLNLFSIYSSFTGPNIDNSFYLTIPRKHIKLFSKYIGFDHSEKKKILDLIV